ncbi:class I SAM-dependent methyltransferase [Acidovorax sp. FJL06]|uniref:class I SAM-dependent methyltransferase n=1 Tax=Acidovorax sp. FJL06 TaxID=2153365 RepID=UPI000F57EB2A|nr:class I SAM-dependent methyltransferase [Acidovorax sp. FJL06]RQO80690.1 methyltransferase type 11 [Acidovorax sp. FJL06]
MDSQFESIREQQKASWNRFSAGWKKWDELFMDFMRPVGNEIIHLLDPKGQDVVLDVAAGTGEPGLTIAARIPQGRVVITDLAANMLEIAGENAQRRGLSNVETRVCDVCALPFADQSFDAISCRFGFMFFPDMALAAREMARVLKPGGRVATAVWNVAEKNFWVTATMGAIHRNMALPAPVPGAPGMFRCAQPGWGEALFAQAGLKNVSVREVAGRLDCQTADVYWHAMTEVAAPVVAALGQADDATKEKIREEVYQAIQQKFPDGKVQIDASALVVFGEK